MRLSWQYFQQNGTIIGSTIPFFMMNSIVLFSSVSNVITPLPTKIPTNPILLAACCFALYLSISTAKSGMYFPAQDSPAIKNLFFLYSGNFPKKSSRALSESVAVIESLYRKAEFELKEYPTPAGDSKKIRLDARCQEYSLQVSWSPILQSTPSYRQQGPTYSKNPKREEQPGPPLSHSVTGSALLAPLMDQTKVQWSARLGPSTSKYPEQTLVLNEGGYPCYDRWQYWNLSHFVLSWC